MNKRLAYFCKQAGMAKIGEQAFTAIHGLQTLGITTTFNLEQVFEIGELKIYQNLENVPDVEITLQKVLDGYPLMWHLATRGSVSNSLVGRSNAQTIFGMSIFADTSDSASGTPLSMVQCSGATVSSHSFTFATDGFFTEDVSLVCNDKRWITSIPFPFSGAFSNTDSPLALASGWGGGVARRQDFSWNYGDPTGLDVNGMAVCPSGTILPPDIYGITASGTNVPLTNSEYTVSVSRITASVDLGREQLLELGHKSPYFRYVTFPVQTTCEIEITAKDGDRVNASESTTLSQRTIKLCTKEGTKVDLGTSNKLASVTFGGGDATGGNDTITYTYNSFNDWTITHPMQPA